MRVNLWQMAHAGQQQYVEISLLLADPMTLDHGLSIFATHGSTLMTQLSKAAWLFFRVRVLARVKHQRLGFQLQFLHMSVTGTTYNTYIPLHMFQVKNKCIFLAQHSSGNKTEVLVLARVEKERESSQMVLASLSAGRKHLENPLLPTRSPHRGV